MKKIMLGLCLAAAPLIASADNGAGCGWGSLLMEGQTGWFAHTSAGTTNGTSGNQTFGMTSGTAGCDVSKPVDHASVFIDMHQEKVARDMSVGSGETLAALSEILGVQPKDQAAFSALVKDNFATIYTSGDVNSDQVTANIVALMKKDATLAKYVA